MPLLSAWYLLIGGKQIILVKDKENLRYNNISGTLLGPGDFDGSRSLGSLVMPAVVTSML